MKKLSECSKCCTFQVLSKFSAKVLVLSKFSHFWGQILGYFWTCTDKIQISRFSMFYWELCIIFSSVFWYSECWILHVAYDIIFISSAEGVLSYFIGWCFRFCPLWIPWCYLHICQKYTKHHPLWPHDVIIHIWRIYSDVHKVCNSLTQFICIMYIYILVLKNVCNSESHFY